MPKGSIVLLAVAGVVGLLIWKVVAMKSPTSPQSRTSTQTGGAQTSAPSDPFAQGLNAAASILGSLVTIAQTAPKSLGS